MRSQHCAAPGCGRFVRRGALLCANHEGSAVVEPQIDREANEGVPTAEFDTSAEEFERRLEARDYRFLFGEALNDVIQQAAEERGLSDEIGILRVVLARILFEERDPAQLAESISRVAGVAIQAARTQRAISGEQAGDMTDALTRLLIELDSKSTPR